ncbi:MAG: STN domain-containing protein [Planctomycetota bacterium]|jgi:type II secretory pathway component HofQ
MTGLLVGCASSTPEGVTEGGETPAADEAEHGAPSTDDGDATPVADDEAKARETLATKRVSVDFEDAPIATVVTYLGTQSGLNIAWDPKVHGELEANDVRVNLQVDDIPLQSAFKILFEFTGLAMEWQHGVFYVSYRKEGSVAEGDHPADAAAAAKIDAALDAKKVSPNFNDTPLDAVMQFFRDVSGINILISPKVFEETPRDALRVSLQVTDVSMRDALNLILDMTNLKFEIRDGVMVIVPK